MAADRKSTRLNSSHTVIYTLSLHDALPISPPTCPNRLQGRLSRPVAIGVLVEPRFHQRLQLHGRRSEEHTSELQSHRDLHSFPTRRSSDLAADMSQPPPGPTFPAGSHRSPGGTSVPPAAPTAWP